MPGGKTPSGAAVKVLAIGKGTPIRQTTPVAGYQRKAETSPAWRTMMGWKGSKLVTSG